tara:strand:+ start:3516 stop:6857 length:3342 start_codon:yes stop_codon:yes gene_type:complete
MRLLLSLTLIVLGLFSHGQSVLNDGSWFKLGTTTEGIYKLDRDYLVNLGIPGSVDPRTIKLYNHGFRGKLPQANSIVRPFDPVEINIAGYGTSDGTLDQNDYFLFYSQGPDRLLFDEEGYLDYDHNIYSDTLYFLITYGGENQGKRIPPAESRSLVSDSRSSYLKMFSHEKDEYNQLESGRRWMTKGVTRSNNIMDFSYSVPEATGAISLWTSFAADSEGPCSFDVLVNNEEIGVIEIDSITGATYSQKQKYSEDHLTANMSGSTANLRFRFNHSSGNSIGFLDYFVLGVESSFESNENIIRIAPGTQYNWNIPSDLEVWDVTNLTSVKKIPVTNNVFTNLPDESVLVALKGNDFSNPTSFGPVPNQNIKSLASSEAIIVTHPKFLSQAQRLARFHESLDNMTVGVVTTTQVYNEFSSGAQDITAIRDYFKYCYDQGKNLKYGLLFGDASYDYKNLLANNTNYVPIYESRESSHNIFSHSSDDYFGFMEDNEGEWSEGKLRNNSVFFEEPYEDHTLEIGIGRLPTKTLEEAEIVVDKIIRYKTATQVLGKWRQQVAYLVDDGDRNEHVRQAEIFYDIIEEDHFQYNTKKLYLDRYDQDVEPGPNSPVTKDVVNTIKDGVFMFNYVGHGNEFQLTSLQELAIDRDVIRGLSNRHKLPLFVTATCEFGRYDNPIRDSGAELLMSNANGGAIALITTTRPVYAHTNEPVNIAIHENLFRRVGGEYPRLGDVIKNAKNESLSGPINRNFALLGDPMLRLNYPQYDITLDQFQAEQDTLSALQRLNITGTVKNGSTRVDDFNGTATITVWDIPQAKTTLGDESEPFTFEEQTNALYRGDVSVIEGTFDAEIILPKNISYKYQKGKITIYASNVSGYTDASGATRNFVIGGTATNLESDTDAPEISMYLNDQTFKSGGTVGPSSLFIAELSDENGINISNNGFGQGITLQLNDSDPVPLNEFYTAELDTYKKGYVVYPLQNLSPGKYIAKLKVSDTYNNFTESTVEFYVSDTPSLKIFNALNYPNPVNSNEFTTFSFEHDREDEQLEINLMLYDLHGQLVNQLDHTVDSSSRKIDYLTMRMSNFQGSGLKKGIYLYRLKVSSTLDDASNEIVKRLIIIN